MIEFRAVVMFFSSFWIIIVSSSIQRQCAEFMFNRSIIVGDTVYVSEGNTAMNFSLKRNESQYCQNISKYKIEVINDYSKPLVPYYSFSIQNMACFSTPRHYSNCSVARNEAWFYMTLKPSDNDPNITWTFQTTGVNVPTRYLQFVFTDPPRIVNVSVTTGANSSSTSDVLAAGFAAYIHCRWDNGGHPGVQPPRVVLDTNNSAKLISSTSSTVVYQLQNVTCEDAGTVTCSLEGSNKTAPLLVGCPPKIGHTKWLNLLSQINSLPSDVPVKMPTYHITSCTLQSRGSQTYREKNCTRDITAYGDPPFLKLNLSLLRFGTTDVADVWELRIANEYGSDSLFINASFDSSEEPLKDVRPNNKNPMVWVIPLAFGVFLITTTLIVIKIWCVFHKEKTQDKAKPVSDLVLPPLYRGSNVSINISNDLYVKLSDVNIRQSPLSPCDSVLFGKGDYVEIRPPVCGYAGGDRHSQEEGHVGSPFLVEETKNPSQTVRKTVGGNLYVSAEEVRRKRRSTEEANVTRS